MKKNKKKKVICFIPIKKNSERLKSKNFRTIDGKPLYKHIVDKVNKIKEFDKIVVDTDSAKIQSYCKLKNITFIKRLDYLKTNKPDFINKVQTEKVLSEDSESILKEAINEVTSSMLATV